MQNHLQWEHRAFDLPVLSYHNVIVMSTLRPFFINGKINLRLGDLPLEHKIPPWLPVLLQELKTGLSENSVFGVYHPDAVELYSVCNSLSKVTIMITWKWNDQHVMSMGQRKILSLWQDLNLWPPKHWAGALSTWAMENYLMESKAIYSVLSTLPDNPGDSRFWTVSPCLQIRVWNLLDNCWSLQFLVYATLCRWNFQVIFCVVWAI